MTNVRRATPADVPAIAALFRRTRLAGLPDLHTPAEDLAFFEGCVREKTVWVAEQLGDLQGYVISAPGWIDHLFVALEHQRRGVGSALLDVAASEGELRLWTFQRNHQARRFYERQGFAVERFTDGAENEEREPDVLYTRPG